MRVKNKTLTLEELLDTILGDPQKKAALLLRIGLDQQQTRQPITEGDCHLTPSGSLQVAGCTHWHLSGHTCFCRCHFQVTQGIRS